MEVLMSATEVALLLDDAAVSFALKLDLEDVEWLVSTGQLLPIFLNGKRRFPLQSLQELIASYEHTQTQSN
jgi:hypothetical protein